MKGLTQDKNKVDTEAKQEANTKEESPKAQPPTKKNIEAVYFFFFLFLPNIPLFFLYNNNFRINHIDFGNVFIVAGFLAMFGLAVYAVLRIITKNAEGAFLAAILFWAGFWLFEILFSITIRIFAFMPRLPRSVLLLAIGIIILAIAILFRKYKPPLYKMRQAFIFVAASFVLLFVFNLFPGVSNAIALERGRAQGSQFPFELKNEFHVDPRLPSPDIYWLYMDGIINQAMAEAFFGNSQDELRSELTERDFFVAENTELRAGNTSSAMLTLFSPTFYDSYLGEQMFNAERLALETGEMRTSILYRLIAQDGINLYTDAFPHFELFNAFRAAGYKTTAIAFGFERFSFDQFDAFYSTLTELRIASGDIGLDFIGRLLDDRNLVNLMTQTTPFSLFNTIINEYQNVEWSSFEVCIDAVDDIMINALPRIEQKERTIYRALIDNHQSMLNHPNFVFVAIDFGHPFFWEQDVSLQWAEGECVYDLYSNAFENAIGVMLNAIDIILEQNPNAVIVIQADHGLHMGSVLDHLATLGYTEEERENFRYSVLSALHMPHQYGDFSYPLDPRNITRELVNRFVGENYQLLQ